MSFIGRFRGNQRNRLVQRCGYASTARLRSEKNADREEREKSVLVPSIGYFEGWKMKCGIAAASGEGKSSHKESASKIEHLVVQKMCE